MKMILQIGNRSNRGNLFYFKLNSIYKKTQLKDGFTFIEVMMSLVVLSLGIVVIFQSFLISLDRMKYLNNRLYALISLDNSFVRVERMLRAQQALPSDLIQEKKIDIGVRKLIIKQVMEINTVDELNDIFEVDINIKWPQEKRNISISRSAYISE